MAQAAAFDIVPGEEADLPTMASMFVECMDPDLVTRALFKYGTSFTARSKMVMGMFQENFHLDNYFYYKAVDPATREMVGFVALGILSESWAEEEEAAAKAKESTEGNPEGGAPDFLNASFADAFFGGFTKMHDRLWRGQRHAFIRTLMVKPTHQRLGLGSALLGHVVRKHGLDRERVYLQTQMGARNLYRRWGWKDLDYLDHDLGLWLGKMRGYGMHRSIGLVREPGEWKADPSLVSE